MSILHSQLAIFGAVDELVVEARKGNRGSIDQAVLATAEKLLPNSTGFGEAGWYRELEQFFNREGIRNPARTRVVFPDLDAATKELTNVPEPATGSDKGSSEMATTFAAVTGPTGDGPGEPAGIAPIRDPDKPGGFEDQTLYNSAKDPVLARAGYAAFVLLKLGKLVGWDQLPRDLTTPLTQVLRTSLRSFTSADKIIATADEIVAQVENINSRQQWADFVGGRVSALFAGESKPCFGTLQEINGQYCSTVVTDTTDPDLSVNDIERIVDPINWSICSKFFCTMKQNVPNRNLGRWSRVRETVGAECSEYGLTTDLIFYKVRQKDGGIYLNYDIDPERTDPGYVEVDNGYIWISPLTANKPELKGVRIRTSKQEHVNGLSPCATAALACLMGWADAGKDMLAGTAHRLIQVQQQGGTLGPLKKFYTSIEFDPAEQEV